MKLKVCGMKHGENIQEVAALQPDYMGFIFYEQSKRNFEGIIPSGTPMIQIIPFKRESWTLGVKKYNPDFNILNLFPDNYQGKIYGWTTHLDLVLHRVVIFVLINPSYNFLLLKNLLSRFLKTWITKRVVIFKLKFHHARSILKEWI